ncbi:MAG: hypothetical protein ACI9RG_000441 [Sulfurimonas sp.]|jgi:hypothetical protein
MSKLINLHTKRDPIKDWEEKNLANNKKDNISFHKEQKVYHQSKTKVYDSPKDIARISELLAMKEEIRVCLNSTVSAQKKLEGETVEKRKKQLLSIKKHLEMHI